MQLTVNKFASVIDRLLPIYMLFSQYNIRKGKSKMILADKIIKLRKQYGWSQEELAEKMSVSRQSVSKWESATSIPNLNKIIRLADIFSVSTDYLIKDEIEHIETTGVDIDENIVKASLEEATEYAESKIIVSKMIAKGVLFCIYSIAPLFLFLGLAKGKQFDMTTKFAYGIGFAVLFILVAIGVSFILRSNQHKRHYEKFENDFFELEYGVKSIFSEKAKLYKSVYSIRLSICITMFLISIIPLLLVGIFVESSMMLLLMFVVMFIIIGAGVLLLILSVSEKNAYDCVLCQGKFSLEQKTENKRIKKWGTFYWLLVLAVFLLLRLFKMDSEIAGIIFPVSALIFYALIKLARIFDSDKHSHQR